MSRAFVRENDDAPPQPMPDRIVSAAANLVTPRGMRLMEQRLFDLNEALAAGPAAVMSKPSSCSRPRGPVRPWRN